MRRICVRKDFEGNLEEGWETGFRDLAVANVGGQGPGYTYSVERYAQIVLLMLTIWIVDQGPLEGSQAGILSWWQFCFSVSVPLLNLHGIHDWREW